MFNVQKTMKQSTEKMVILIVNYVDDLGGQPFGYLDKVWVIKVPTEMMVILIVNNVPNSLSLYHPNALGTMYVYLIGLALLVGLDFHLGFLLSCNFSSKSVLHRANMFSLFCVYVIHMSYFVHVLLREK